MQRTELVKTNVNAWTRQGEAAKIKERADGSRGTEMKSFTLFRRAEMNVAECNSSGRREAPAPTARAGDDEQNEGRPAVSADGPGERRWNEPPFFFFSLFFSSSSLLLFLFYFSSFLGVFFFFFFLFGGESREIQTFSAFFFFFDIKKKQKKRRRRRRKTRQRRKEKIEGMMMPMMMYRAAATVPVGSESVCGTVSSRLLQAVDRHAG
ncbi:uncharacterized protein ARB_00489 [Trichophyton benhamiae CBS 112371]|uniref:Uncharacterized protein n=1 Tax=Arthroderma benhamiae (strain ATCC MYA-4681 / CBS 112371) TaxID=663331 RepID=D4AWC4_ARTBC|nr:uncharacterized protein ARB_00489 [Trichophyton benhamiae CBS 112371]EFE32664.1 hypothetical protein ARB_00489 [Trichophyton benhamiae CBS 112371]